MVHWQAGHVRLAGGARRPFSEHFRTTLQFCGPHNERLHNLTVLFARNSKGNSVHYQPRSCATACGGFIIPPYTDSRSGVVAAQSFNRVAGSANIPLQLNFSGLPEVGFVEIAKAVPLAQYVPVVLPSVVLAETPLPTPLADYLVLLYVPSSPALSA